MKLLMVKEKSLIGMNKKNSFILILLTFLYAFTPLFSDEVKSEGTLIVTYQTGQKGERLDRVRFRLKSENFEAEMYPKGLNFVDDQESMARTVVIENLPSEQYVLQFLIPNKDGFFEEVPSREIHIISNETLKIDQKIKPRRLS